MQQLVPASIMLLLWYSYSRCSLLQKLKKRRTPANYLKQKQRYFLVISMFSHPARIPPSHVYAQINRMKSAIMNESGVIDNLLARIAAAKLAHAEANDQSSQLLQALETEDAAVMKVIFFPPPLGLVASICFSYRSLMIFLRLSSSNELLKKKFCSRVLE